MYLAVTEGMIDQKQITLCREHCLPTTGLIHYIELCAPQFVLIGRERQFMPAILQAMMPTLTFYGNTLNLQVGGVVF